jgi:hypothetical protein
MTTTVVTATGSVSGNLVSWGPTYLTVARQDTATSAATNATPLVGQFHDGTDYNIYQGFLLWDTSAIGSDTVHSVTLAVQGNFGGDQSVIDFVIDAFVRDWGGTLTTADWCDSDTDLPSMTKVASLSTVGFSTAAAYDNTFTSEVAALASINGSGNTMWMLASHEHVIESPSIANEYVTIRGSSSGARLTIVHGTLHAVSPDADTTTTGWTSTPLWSRIDEDPASPDGTVISATAS